MLSPRAFHKTFMFKDRVYAIGGSSAGAVDIEVLDGSGWAPVAQSTMFSIDVSHNLEEAGFVLLT